MDQVQFNFCMQSQSPDMNIISGLSLHVALLCQCRVMKENTVHAFNMTVRSKKYTEIQWSQWSCS